MKDHADRRPATPVEARQVVDAGRDRPCALAGPAAQCQWASAIHNSSKMVAQRQWVDHIARGTAAKLSSRPVVQGYFRVGGANQAAANINVGSTLPAMERFGGVDDAYRNAANALNIQNGTPLHGPGPTLRISDDGRMAIEDADLTGRQPRMFFAEAAMLVTANEQLKARTPVNQNQLQVSGGHAIDVPDAGNVMHHLVGVIPTNHFGTSQNCDAVATRLTGASDSTTPVKLSPGAPIIAPRGARTDDVYERLAHYVARNNTPARGVLNSLEQLNDNGRRMGPPPGGAAGALPVALPDMGNINNQVANERARAAGAVATDMDAREQLLGINAYADPDVGDMYGSMSLGAGRDIGGARYQYDEQRRQYSRPPQIWGTHFGGVVLKSGSDHVTLENYNRSAEDRALPNPEAHGRWYFQMYGTKRVAALPVHGALGGLIQPGDEAVEADQSWHRAWSAAGRPVINAVTAVIGRTAHPLNAAAMAALTHAGTAGSGEITRGHEVDIRINCTPAMQNELMAGMTGDFQEGLDAVGAFFGLRNPVAAAARQLAANAAILRVFANTVGEDTVKLAAAKAARTQLIARGAGSASTRTPANLRATLIGYGITVLPLNV